MPAKTRNRPARPMRYAVVLMLTGAALTLLGCPRPPQPPTVAAFSLDAGAATTTTGTVTLNNTATNNPTEYMASEATNFAGASWTSYATAPTFLLSAGNGTKTVYFKVRSDHGESNTVSDTITVAVPLAPQVTAFSLDNGGTTSTTGTVTLNNTAVNNPTEYMASEAADFTGAAWTAYAAAPSFVLSAGNGAKTVYFKTRNDTGESNVVSDTISRNVPVAPEVTAFSLDNGADSTAIGTVTLDNTTANAPTEYMASESADFSGATWESYSANPGFVLSGTDGLKTVYFKTRNAAGESNTMSDTIDVDYLWAKHFGNDTHEEWAKSVVATPDGGYIAVGSIYNLTGHTEDAYAIKFDAAGNVIWEQSYGGTGDDQAEWIAATNDGGYIVAGGTVSSGAGSTDMYLFKIDANGNVLWEKTFGGELYDIAWCVAVTSDGGYIVVGETTSLGAGGYDTYVVKTNAAGDEVWQKTFGGTGDDGAFGVVANSDGSFVVAGIIEPDNANVFYAFVTKADSSGNELWSKSLGNSAETWAESLAATADGGFIVVGVTYDADAAAYDAYAAKLGSTSFLEWETTFGGPLNDEANAVAATADGGCVVAAQTYSYGAGNCDAYMLKLDSTGFTEWENTAGTTRYDNAKAVTLTPGGGYVFVGETFPVDDTNGQVYVVKTDSAGNHVAP